MFLFFGRKSILSSVLTWQSILYPPIFTRIIDLSLAFLFDWSCTNISHAQKVAAYAHLYSFASVKAVVHWFQIMRNGAFVMYDDDVAFPRFFSSTTSTNPNGAGSGKSRIYGYRPARFPTRNITTPIVLLYGSRDGLVDIAAMRRELPPDTTRERRLEGYEHLDVLWGRDVHLDVIPVVKEMLDEYGREMRGGGGIEGLQGLQGLKG
jgi:lysosomal acid lipase/cholesteryl ester hydrolase